MAQKHKITSYSICIVKKEGKWVRDFSSKVVECQTQIGVGANQKTDKITPVTLTEPAQWIECAFAPCWRYETTIDCMASSFAGLLLAGLPLSFDPICAAQALISLLETLLSCLRPPPPLFLFLSLNHLYSHITTMRDHLMEPEMRSGIVPGKMVFRWSTQGSEREFGLN